MKRQAGFTLVELMAVMTIVGVLAATSLYMYGEYRQRATGSEASLMLKSILDAQIIYFLEKDDFYPIGNGSSFIIPSDATPTPLTQIRVQGVRDTLKITIPVGHNLEYTFTNYGTYYLLKIRAEFSMFPDGERELWGTLTTDGKIDILRTG